MRILTAKQRTARRLAAIEAKRARRRPLILLLWWVAGGVLGTVTGLWLVEVLAL